MLGTTEMAPRAVNAGATANGSEVPMTDEAYPSGYCECGCGRITNIYQGKPRRYIHGHQRRKPGPDYEITAAGCWQWIRTVDPSGYGVLSINARRHLAHRHYYEQQVGPIPEGLVIDHLCRNTRCVNPAHLEAVTTRENILRGVGWSGTHARKTHCPAGHPLEGDNLSAYHLRKGQRKCLACHAARQRERRAA
ncbi:MAG: endonuclease [uncultured Gemmatimonadetes bacterium]|uniref:Endonuclease n=1 Tax=uncultured Gemmatimonadota bacterium TaxID=203437 RepID=A0A6J4L6D4_9BACT|nr:MAG: endonuclease [uncultured Gemmatimonadota bacterium]